MSLLRALLSFAGIIERPRMVSARHNPKFAPIVRALEAGDVAPLEQAMQQRMSWDDRGRLVSAVAGLKGRPEWIDQWVNRKRSADAYLISGAHCVMWAWEARGGGWSDTVTDDGWQQFFARLQRAKIELQKAAELAPADPTPWEWLLPCARGLQLEIEDSQEFFNEAIARDPRNFGAHSMMLQNLCEKWGGSSELMFAHARRASAKDRPGGKLHELIAVAHFEESGSVGRDGGDAEAYFKQPDVRAEIAEAARKSIFADDADDEELLSSLNWFALLFSWMDENRLATQAFNRIKGRMAGPWEVFEKPRRIFSMMRLFSATGGDAKGGSKALDDLKNLISAQRRFRTRLGLTMFALLGAWLGIQQLGVRGTFPTELPSVRIARDWESRTDNAKPHYARATDALIVTDLPWRDQLSRSLESMPLEIAAWVRENEPVIEHIRKAASIDGCYLRQNQMYEAARREEDQVTRVRDLGRMLALRARLAAEARDLPKFEESLALMGGIARHLGQHPFVITQLNGSALTALQAEYLLVPLTWPELSREQRAAYVARFLGKCEAPTMSAAAWRHDAEEFMIESLRAGNGTYGLILPHGRIAGEFDKLYAPTLDLANAPVEEQANPDSAVRVAVHAGEFSTEPWYVALYNLPRFVASIAQPRSSRAFELRVRAVALQRGNDAVLAIHGFKDQRGEWPKLLSAISPAPPIDPYSSAPFIYKVTPSGFTLYSVGLDRDDDGGTHDERFGEKKPARPNADSPPPDGDYVFWPIQYKPTTTEKTVTDSPSQP